MAAAQAYTQFPQRRHRTPRCEPAPAAVRALPGQEAADLTVNADESSPEGMLRRLTPTTEHIGPRAETPRTRTRL